MKINAKGVHYRELNQKIRQAVEAGETDIRLDAVNGQRYIGGGLKGQVHLAINGVPGNALASFMDGPTIEVSNNAQDGVGNTMNAGKVVVNGDAGDILGYAMRGGKLFVRGNVGYRVGIHMKSYQDKQPVIVIGGGAGDFLGEYMAGGLIVVLCLDQKDGRSCVGNYIGTGMHAGTIYIRGEVQDYQVGKEVGIREPTDDDMAALEENLREYCKDVGLSVKNLLKDRYTKLIPYSSRPYGKLYAY
jgi:glutamate synthase domain-containing protein 3